MPAAQAKACMVECRVCHSCSNHYTLYCDCRVGRPRAKKQPYSNDTLGLEGHGLIGSDTKLQDRKTARCDMKSGKTNVCKPTFRNVHPRYLHFNI
jgi:hypothetical protein